ncbi:unnamed protein product [Anisakis simplex]|uniref:A-kinase anchor protein 10, mitochondrial n=1 Tax=Anisakis simplex TaxID=6269 RepID=A0A0M3KIE2_ANISI|nr:unnamed protein product [Anisakis simplex]
MDASTQVVTSRSSHLTWSLLGKLFGILIPEKIHLYASVEICFMEKQTHDREEDGDVGDKDELLTSLLKSTRCRGMASVSQGVLPTNSSRTSINAGVKRYKFKTTESLHRPSEADSRNYQAAVNCARVSFDADRSVEQLCRSLLDIHFDRSNWDVVREEEYTQRFVN